MKRLTQLAAGAVLCCTLAGYLESAHQARECNAPCEQFHINSNASSPLRAVILTPPNGCTTRMSNGFTLPDPTCTPGAINPTLNADVLRNPAFRTCCVRNNATTEQQKASTYDWYHITHPTHNTGQSQTSELDHLVSLELGGADTLDNIWPQCGPPEVALGDRYFKQKDMVENYLAAQVKAGSIDLGDAQEGIANDWTQYLEAAKAHFHRSGGDK